MNILREPCAILGIVSLKGCGVEDTGALTVVLVGGEVSMEKNGKGECECE